jgi:hypothetical protein
LKADLGVIQTGLACFFIIAIKILVHRNTLVTNVGCGLEKATTGKENFLHPSISRKILIFCYHFVTCLTKYLVEIRHVGYNVKNSCRRQKNQ